MKEKGVTTYTLIYKHGFSAYQAILMPALGTGTYGFGHKETAEPVVNLIQDFVESNELTVYLVLYESGIDTLYRKYMK